MRDYGCGRKGVVDAVTRKGLRTQDPKPARGRNAIAVPPSWGVVGGGSACGHPPYGLLLPADRAGAAADPYVLGYSSTVNTLLKSDVFDPWLVALQDRRGKARIITYIRRAELGNFGDTKPVGEGVHEMRVHSGPG